MDRLWTPWRYQYITGESGEKSEAAATANACIFCSLAGNPANDERNFILHRAAHNFIVLNLYPYASGHLLIIPYQHTSELDAVSKEASHELMDLAKHAQTVLRSAYQPHGFNLGINQGNVAGAGIAGHLHQHVVPRWGGDTNFMPVIGRTRVLPQLLADTRAQLAAEWSDPGRR